MRRPRPHGETLADLSGALARVLEVPGVVISIIDGPHEVFRHLPGSHAGVGANAMSTQVSSLCMQVARSGQPLLVHDLRQRGITLADDGLSKLGVASYAGVPLMGHNDRRLGTLAAVDLQPRAWQTRDLVVLRAFARAVTAVQEARDLRTDHARAALMEDQALHDELTGLLNRRGFRLVAESHLALARRDGLPGVLLYIDVDGLKQVNDGHGHATGDTLLRDAARVLQDTFREADTVGRLGGDEFVVLSIHAGESDRPAIAARLAAGLRRINRDRDDHLPLIWSVGMAAFGATGMQTLDTLIADADRTMYRMKRKQR
jgi:diguanylate cyclase (GGDEF)-like protein